MRKSKPVFYCIKVRQSIDILPTMRPSGDSMAFPFSKATVYITVSVVFKNEGEYDDDSIQRDGMETHFLTSGV